jgi:peroxiredoxin
MKKALGIIAIALLIASALFYTFQEQIKEVAIDALTEDMFVPEDNDEFDPGPALGSHFPGVNALYQGEQLRQITGLAGAKGTVLVASRSLDWCPYCMRQMIHIQEHKALFDQAGLGLVAITYDEPALQQVFIDRYDITLPILSDIDALTFKTLGILNGDYQEGDFQYGIPHPGMIVINPEGIVVGKLFLEAYSSRVDSAAALNFALQALATE